MHETHHGKVGITSKVEVKTRDDLSTAYTPGVAEPCRKIKENPDDVYKYTFKGNMVAVVSNGRSCNTGNCADYDFLGFSHIPSSQSMLRSSSFCQRSFLILDIKR